MTATSAAARFDWESFLFKRYPKLKADAIGSIEEKSERRSDAQRHM
jgi:hypothetical protein